MKDGRSDNVIFRESLIVYKNGRLSSKPVPADAVPVHINPDRFRHLDKFVETAIYRDGTGIIRLFTGEIAEINWLLAVTNQYGTRYTPLMHWEDVESFKAMFDGDNDYQLEIIKITAEEFYSKFIEDKREINHSIHVLPGYLTKSASVRNT